MKKIFLFLILLFSISNVKAYENDYFKFDVPDKYTLETVDEVTYKWELDNNYVSISISDNTQLNYNISNYTQEDIQNQKEYIENNINKQLSSYNIKVDVTSIGKKEFNDTYLLNYHIYWPTKIVTGNDTYQIGNVFTTNNYIITMIYSSNEEIKDDDTIYNSIINSFSIKDEKVKKRMSKNYYVTLCGLGILIAIICIIRSNLKKRNK